MNSSSCEGPNAKQQKIAKTDVKSDTEKQETSIIVAPNQAPMEVIETEHLIAKTETVINPLNVNEGEVQEIPIQPVIKTIVENEKVSRRGSQESTITNTTTTNSHSTSTSSDSSSDSSDSDSSSSEDDKNQEDVFIDQEQINQIYKMCIKNLEECISRFPEHYKSIYRLVHHFLNINISLDRCKQLLLTNDYKTTLGNSIAGLFHERKNNNFFNGVWRIPSQEIDRPGNFTSHLSKCIIILMDVLKKTNDYETLIDLALQLQRNPENDKKYLNDTDKKELFQQAVACSVQAFKNKLREIIAGIGEGKNTDRDLLSLMLEIFKANRKTLKTFQQKDQSLFSGVLVDVYKEYIKDKMVLPETANYTDLAFKMCQQEINYRKNLEKGIITPNPNPPGQSITTSASTPPLQVTHSTPTTSSPILVKSVSEINKSVLGNSNANIASNQTQSVATTNTQNTPQNPKKEQSTNSSTTPSTSTSSAARTKPRSSNQSKSSSTQNQLNSVYNSLVMAFYSNPSMFSSPYMTEYFKMMGISNASQNLTPQQLSMLTDPTGLFANMLTGAPSPTSSASSSKSGTTSSYEAKFMESLLASTSATTSSAGGHLQGLQQNLASNSLSITTTTISSSTSTSTNRLSSSLHPSKQQVATSRKSSELKDSRKSSSYLSKSNSESSMKYNLLSTGLNLPDLPKSLSITPTMPSGSSHKTPAEKKQSKESKNSSAMLSKFNLNPALSITPEGFSTAQSNRSSSSSSTAALSNAAATANMMKSYEEFLKNYSPSKNFPSSLTSSPTGHQQQSGSSKKQHHASNLNYNASMSSKQQSKQSKATSQMSSMQSSGSKSQPKSSQSASSSAKVPYDFGKNIASSFIGNPSASPVLSHSPFSHQTPPLTPSPSLSQSRPSSSNHGSNSNSGQKTLQQKMMERKQQNQQQKNAKKSASDNDVIVLD
jgi:calcineurin-binding protein cabin-1